MNTQFLIYYKKLNWLISKIKQNKNEIWRRIDRRIIERIAREIANRIARRIVRKITKRIARRITIRITKRIILIMRFWNMISFVQISIIYMAIFTTNLAIICLFIGLLYED